MPDNTKVNVNVNVNQCQLRIFSVAKTA